MPRKQCRGWPEIYLIVESTAGVEGKKRCRRRGRERRKNENDTDFSPALPLRPPAPFPVATGSLPPVLPLTLFIVSRSHAATSSRLSSGAVAAAPPRSVPTTVVRLHRPTPAPIPAPRRLAGTLAFYRRRTLTLEPRGGWGGCQWRSDRERRKGTRGNDGTEVATIGRMRTDREGEQRTEPGWLPAGRGYGRGIKPI